MNDAAMDAKVLRRAAELVLQGHCKGAYARDWRGMECAQLSDAAEAWCAIGAFGRAATEILGDCEAAMRFRNDNVDRLMPMGRKCAPWNDAPETTAQDVANALREAADRCEAASGLREPEPSDGDARAITDAR